MILKAIVSIFLSVSVCSVFSQENWELAKDKNDIKVYTTKDASSKFKSIKVEAVLTGTLQKLMHVLMDVSDTKNWVYSTKEAYLIKKISTNEILYYTETSLPWPVSNRDVPVLMKLYPDAANNTLKVIATAAPDAIPEKKGIVRVKDFNAVWNVKSDGKNKITITYFLKANPGGSVPSGITNMFISKGPYETFNNLAGLLKQ